MAVDQIASGWDSMKEGAAIFLLPAPTTLDELIGGGKMVWGFGEIIQGFVELIDEDWW